MDDLAGPPLWQLWLFETPAAPMAVLIVVAVGLVLLYHRRRQMPLLKAAGILVLLAGANAALAAVVQTERERLMGAAEDLVQVAGRMDAAALEGHFSPEAFLAIGPGEPAMDLPELMEVYKAGVRRHPIRDQDAVIHGADLPGDGVGRVDLTVGTTFQSRIYGQQRFRTRWRMVFHRDGDGQWRLAELRWVAVEGPRPGQQSRPRLDWLRM